MKKRWAEGSKMCFGCSTQNSIGLKLTFTMEDELCRTRFTAGPLYQGWNGCLHGGIIAALLDETMAWWLWQREVPVMTAEMTTRYKLSVPTLTELLVESWCEEAKRERLYTMAARIVLPDEQVAATARGKFMRIDPAQLPEKD